MRLGKQSLGCFYCSPLLTPQTSFFVLYNQNSNVFASRHLASGAENGINCVWLVNVRDVGGMSVEHSWELWNSNQDRLILIANDVLGDSCPSQSCSASSPPGWGCSRIFLFCKDFKLLEVQPSRDESLLFEVKPGGHWWASVFMSRCFRVLLHLLCI